MCYSRGGRSSHRKAQKSQNYFWFFAIFVPFCGYSLPVLVKYPACRIADSLIELIDFIGRRADILQKAWPSFDALDDSFFDSPELFGLALPRCRIYLRIGDGHVQLDDVVCNPAIPLFQDHINAVRVTEVVDPGSFINAGRRDDERVAFPAACRVSPPSRQIGIHERFSSIRPDGAKTIAPFKVLINPVRQDDELYGIGVNQSAARAHRIAILIRIGAIRGRDGSATSKVLFGMSGGFRTSQIPAIGGLVGVEHFLPRRCERRNIVAEPTVYAVAAGAAATVSARTSVSGPEARKVALVVRLIGIFRISGHDAALR